MLLLLLLLLVVVVVVCFMNVSQEIHMVICSDYSLIIPAQSITTPRMGLTNINIWRGKKLSENTIK